MNKVLRLSLVNKELYYTFSLVFSDSPQETKIGLKSGVGFIGAFLLGF